MAKHKDIGSIPVIGTLMISRRFYVKHFDPLAQLVEHLTFNQRVRRSNRLRVTIIILYARVAKSVDALDLKSNDSNIVSVQVRPRVPSLGH